MADVAVGFGISRKKNEQETEEAGEGEVRSTKKEEKLNITGDQSVGA